MAVICAGYPGGLHYPSENLFPNNEQYPFALYPSNDLYPCCPGEEVAQPIIPPSTPIYIGGGGVLSSGFKKYATEKKDDDEELLVIISLFLGMN